MTEDQPMSEVSTFGAQSRRNEVLRMFTRAQEAAVSAAEQLDRLDSTVQRFVTTATEVAPDRLLVDVEAWRELRNASTGGGS